MEICRRLDGIPLAIELAASRMASMTATEVRDRLDQRFKLLVGSRRGLERHQTLRQAVQWSYDLLDEPEKALLERCSVFAGGFDVQSACAVAGTDETDEFAILDLLDALVRKSLLVADRTTGRTRFSMLETIRQFAEEQLVDSGEAVDARTAHARHFAGRETDIIALWDSPRQREAYVWFTTELANLRTAFRWAADHGNLDEAATIAVLTSLLGICVEKLRACRRGLKSSSRRPEPLTTHGSATLYMMAIAVLGGRTESRKPSDIAKPVRRSHRRAQVRVPLRHRGRARRAVNMAIGQAERTGRVVLAQIARTRPTSTRMSLACSAMVIALIRTGR